LERGMVVDGVDVFVKVVQAGGFSAAARQLGMPTTTVSAKIARLEEALGVTLLRRTTRRMSVTPAGESYYLRCAEALRALADGEEQLAAERTEPTGLLRLTAPSDLAQVLLPPIIGRYIETYPKAQLELIVTNVQVDLVAEGVDLALRAGLMRDSTLQSRKFGSGSLGLFASEDYLKRRGTPKAPADLSRHEVIVHSRFPTGITLTATHDRSGFSVTPGTRVRADDMQTLRALAASGLGIALMPEFPGSAREKELVRVLPDYSSQAGAVYFVYPAGKYTPVKVRAFIEIAIDRI
jgi:DNA-binding transcriptional LysR family regulator